MKCEKIENCDLSSIRDRTEKSQVIDSWRSLLSMFHFISTLKTVCSISFECALHCHVTQGPRETEPCPTHRRAKLAHQLMPGGGSSKSKKKQKDKIKGSHHHTNTALESDSLTGSNNGCLQVVVCTTQPKLEHHQLEHRCNIFAANPSRTPSYSTTLEAARYARACMKGQARPGNTLS